MADRFIVLIDDSKCVDYLGQTFKLPVEVDKFNWLLVSKKIGGHMVRVILKQYAALLMMCLLLQIMVTIYWT